MWDINPAFLRQHIDRKQHGLTESRDGLHLQTTSRIQLVEAEISKVHRGSPSLEQSPKSERKDVEKNSADQQRDFVVSSRNPEHRKHNPRDLAQA